MYNKVFQLQADFLKALAHGKRLEIIHLLRDQEMCVSSIQAMLGLPQANLSQHLQILREAKAVNTRREGKQVYYQVSHPEVLRACDLIKQVLIDHHQDDPVVKDLQQKIKDLVPLTRDLVCGMRLSPKSAAFVHHHQGKNYYFCASGCYQAFKKDPTKYV